MKARGWMAGLALVLAAGVAAEAEPPEKHTTRYKGLEGYGAFAVDGDCSSLYLDLYAIEESGGQAPGPPDTQHYVALFYSSYDWCTGHSTYGYGETADAVIQGSAVRSLRAEATVELEECSLDPFTYEEICQDGVAVLALDWMANGEQATQGVDNNRVSTPFFTVRSHSVGSTATANVSGTLVLNGTDILPILTWSAGGLSRTRQGSIEFVRF